jgi:alpha-glucosidase
MRRSRHVATLALAVAASCSEEESLRPIPVDVETGGALTATVVEGNRLVVAATDGRVLLDGLGPGAVADGAAPLVGFATRDVTTTYEMQFGAFKPTITPSGPWTVATSVHADGSIVSVGAAGAELARLAFSSPEEGHLVVELALPPGAEPSGDPSTATRLSWGFACDAEDHFAGFGAQTWDADHRGQSVPTFVTEGGIGKSTTDDYVGLWMLQGQRHSSHAPIPQYLSRRGYVATLETDRNSTFALCSERETAARLEVDLPATLHLFDGPAPAQAIERASATFGRPRTPPRVAFAPWLDAVFGSDNVRRVAQKLRDENIPVSVIWTEDWRGGDWSNDNYSLKEEWEVDRSLYPDIEALADDLHALGYHFHVYFNPFVYQGSKAWAETQPNGWLVKRADGTDYTFPGAKFTDTGLIDLDDPDARAWAIGKMQDAIALGADGWMNDFAEWLPTDAVTAAGPAYERHNLYPVEWARAARAAIDGVDDGTERLFFGRSAWFGTPELMDVFWAGDQRTTFDADDGMPTVVPQAIGLGVVGISTFGHDIAGYQSANNPGSTKELYFRWTELGAWSPVMRTHHGAQPDLEWSWEKDDETIAHFRRYAELHMSLVPTFAGLAAEATATGLPIWRGLALRYPEDAAVWPITDQIMLGDGLMIAPVQSDGARARDVYFPAGRWYSWTGRNGTVVGPATLSVDAPLGEIPVFARAGAIVPTYPPGVMTLVNGSAEVPDASLVGDDRVVFVFLGADGAFTEADGLSYALTSTDVGGALALSLDGAALLDCGVGNLAPCVAEQSDTSVVVRLAPTDAAIRTLALRGSTGGTATLTLDVPPTASFELRFRR